MLVFTAAVLFGQVNPSATASAGSQGAKGLMVSQPELKVFPNPVYANKFTVEVGSGFIREIRITNIAGVQVYNRKFQTSVIRHEVLTHDFPDGIYLLRINISENTARTLKLVVSNGK